MSNRNWKEDETKKWMIKVFLFSLMTQLPSEQILNWALFADRETSLDAAVLVPTLVFGRGALLVKKPVGVGDRVSVYHQQQPQQQEEHEPQKRPAAAGLEGATTSFSLSSSPGKAAATVAAAAAAAAVVSTPNNSIGSSGMEQ